MNIFCRRHYLYFIGEYFSIFENIQTKTLHNDKKKEYFMWINMNNYGNRLYSGFIIFLLDSITFFINNVITISLHKKELRAIILSSHI